MSSEMISRDPLHCAKKHLRLAFAELCVEVIEKMASLLELNEELFKRYIEDIITVKTHLDGSFWVLSRIFDITEENIEEVLTILDSLRRMARAKVDRIETEIVKMTDEVKDDTNRLVMKALARELADLNANIYATERHIVEAIQSTLGIRFLKKIHLEEYNDVIEVASHGKRGKKEENP